MRLDLTRVLVAALSAVVLCAVAAARAAEDTVEIPESAKALKNPLTASAETLSAARRLWRTHCETCHGTAGRGDGPNARLHELRKSVAPKDLTQPAFQKGISDGEIFWRVTNGLVDGDNIIMPAYGTKMRDDLERWQVVLFVRELGRDAAASSR